MIANIISVVVSSMGRESSKRDKVIYEGSVNILVLDYAFSFM